MIINSKGTGEKCKYYQFSIVNVLELKLLWYAEAKTDAGRRI